jgi:tetratricopeptide (TPR) repeat protein
VGELDGQHIFDELWSLPEGVSPGDEIILEYRLTGGKQFECRAYLAARPSVLLEVTVENPLVNIANPNVTQLKIEKTEEELRQRQGGTARDRDTYVDLARMYAELNQREKALDYLRTAQSRISRPDCEILNLQGIYFGDLGDYDRSTMAFLEADRAEPRWSGPLFNLSLDYRRRGRHAEALETIERAIRKSDDPGPCLSLKALCLESLGRTEESREVAAQAVCAFAPPAALDEWRLGWLLTAAKMAGNDAVRKRAEDEQKKRLRHTKSSPSRDDILRPAIKDDGPPPDDESGTVVKPKPRKKPGGKQGA